MFHTTRRGNSPITLEELLATNIHGRTVWEERDAMDRQACVFDGVTGEIVTLAEFRKRRQARAKERGAAFDVGTRERTERSYFAS